MMERRSSAARDAMYPAAESLEAHLGDPFDSRGRCSLARAVELHETESYPSELTTALDDWGLWAYYIPAENGGRLASFEELAALLRIVARRDLTAAVAHGKTFLGALPVWFAGTAAQKERLHAILAG